MSGILQGLIASYPTASSFPTSGLIAYYKLENNSNDSFSSNNGTDTSMSYIAGKNGNCGSFNGTTSYISIPDSSVFSFTTTIFSVSFWANLSAIGVRSVITKGSASNYEWAIYIDAGKLRAETYNASGSNTLYGSTSTSTMNNGVWRFCTVVFNSAHPTLYIDGVSVAKSNSGITGNPTNTASLVNIGRRGDNAFYYSGLIDEVAVWNTALSSTEVTTLYNSGIGIFY